MPGTWVPAVHANCVHNEIAALAWRSLAPLPKGPDPGISPGVSRMFGRLRQLASAYRGVPWSYLKTAESYSGAMRRRYLEAERSLREDGPLSKRDSLLRAFLKAEKCGSDKDAKPRMIFPRSPRFNLVVASWLKPLEHFLWGYLTAKRLFGGSNTRVVGKGLSPRARANLIIRKFGGFRDCVVFEVDGKAFEAHCVESLIAEEHRIYSSAYPGDGFLRSVLKRQVFSGVSQGGVKFSRRGGRASGDFNTGMGNTLIMLAVVSAVLGSYAIKFDILVDGDNALVFLERADYPSVESRFFTDVLEASGFEMTLESPVDFIEGVRFGRSAPLYLGQRLGWTMVRDWLSVLSGAYASHRWLREPVFGRRWVRGVAQCELSLAVGVPVLQAAAASVLSQLGSVQDVSDDVLADQLYVGARRVGLEAVVEVTREARLSFERAFGVKPEEQVALEGRLSGVLVGHPSGVVDFPPRSRWELAHPGFYEPYFDARV